VGAAIRGMLGELAARKPAALVADRRRKFLQMGSRGLAA
jgi:acetyl-CoA carboxylase carboxyl transferase subunit alpha